MRRLPLLGLTCLLGGCVSHRGSDQVPPGGSAKPGLSARLLAAETRSEPLPPKPEGPDAWRDAVRIGDTADAARLLDALPEERRNTPETRFVRARVAIDAKDFARAKTLLDGLEPLLPILADAVREARAEANAGAGPWEEAARFFASRSDPESLVRAAAAYERAGSFASARASADRALKALGADHGSDPSGCRIRALAIRARAAHALHDDSSAAADFRVIAVEAPETPEADVAMSSLAMLSPPQRLSPEQRLTRAKNLAGAAKLDRALGEIDAAAADPSSKLSPGELAHARGWAYYLSRADYAKAAEELARSAGQPSADSVKDAFYAARALSRSDEDAKAIERYDAFAKAHPDSPLAEEARYQSARLHFLLGEYDPAVVQYRAYLDAFDKKHKARFGGQVRMELALALLASGKAVDAAPMFSALARAEATAEDRALLRELEGASLATAGDKDRAMQCLSGVMRDAPLSFAALLSAARIEQLNLTPPGFLAPPLAPPSAAPKLDVELPERTAVLARLGLVQDAERDLASHADEISNRYAPRGNEALCEAYGAVGAGAERFRVARRTVKGDVLEREPTDATRWAWECLYPRAFDGIVTDVETERALPTGFLHAVMRQESAFKPDAVSPANAVGLLQLMPDTAEKAAREIGIPFEPPSLTRPGTNVRLGGYYLRRVFDRFGGSVPLAAAAYNAGPRAVSRWLSTGETLPLDVFVARIPFAETRTYVARVVANVARYAYLKEGPRALGAVPLDLPQGRRVKEGDY